MLKYLLLIAVLALVVWFWLGRRQTPADSAERPAAPKVPELIVVCAHCQLRVPESEAVRFEGQHYCCEEHRTLDHS